MQLFNHATTSPVSYFHHLAAAFLQGHTYLTAPSATHDLAYFNGHWYVPFPPLPAMVMTPFVAAIGVDSFNVAVFIAAVGAIAMGCLFGIFATMAVIGWTRLTNTGNITLTATFAFGSIVWYMSTTSNVWFVAQVTTFAFVMIAMLAAIRGYHPAIVGSALGLAVMGRPHVVLMLSLLIAIAKRRGERSLVQWSLTLLLPVAFATLGLTLYNYARFGDAVEFGYQYALADGPLKQDFQTFGQVSLHYLPRNLYATFVALPHWNRRVGFWTPDGNGMSVFLAMPFLLFAAPPSTRAGSLIVNAAWLAVAGGLVPPLIYYNTGWYQFGPRFLLDVMPALAVLVAFGVRNGISVRFVTIAAASIAINAAGTAWWHWPR